MFGTPYSETFAASGGSGGTFSYAIAGGLPDIGLTISPASGLLSGSPTISGMFYPIIQATDGNGCSGGRVYVVTIPPAVISSVPFNGASDVGLATPVVVTFSETVKVDSNSFSLECLHGLAVPFTTSPIGASASFSLQPAAALPSAVSCTLTVHAANVVSASNGAAIGADDIVTFTTATVPQVVATLPSSGASSIALNSMITVTFNEPVDTQAGAFALACNGNELSPLGITASPATAFSITPPSTMPPQATCILSITAAGIVDHASGSTHPTSDDVVSFSTITAPAVTATTPASNATSVLATAPISISFSESVNAAAAAFSLSCGPGTPAIISSNAPSNSIALSLSGPLPAGQTCTVTAFAAAVSDAATSSAHLASDYTFTFSIDTPPTIAATTPTNGSMLVPGTTSPTIAFSKPVNASSSSFSIACPSGSPIAFSISASTSALYSLTPVTALPAGVLCSVSVIASQVSDVAGTPLASDAVFSFTVVPPTTAINDTFPETVVGNVEVDSSRTGYSVTANDICPTACTITGYTAASAHGGNVAMTTSGASMGQFTYEPPVGYRGVDSFTYTITSASGSSSATVTLTIDGMVWFVNNNASAGDGRLESAFNTLSAFQAVNDGGANHPSTGDSIFLYDSANAYAASLTLLANQKLIGQDTSSSVESIAGISPGSSSLPLPVTMKGSATPVLITSTGSTIALSQNNGVWGLTLGNATGVALSGTNVGTLTLRDFAIATTGAAVNITGGNLDAILNAVSSGGGMHGILLSNTTGSFDVEGGGPSDPTNTTRGRTLVKQGGGSLILGGGGTIQHATGSGVSLSSATNVTLRNVVIQNNGGTTVNSGGDGVSLLNGSSLTLDNVLIQGQTTNNGIHATSATSLALQHTELTNNGSSSAADGAHVWNVRLDECVGSASVSNSVFHNARENQFGVTNSGSTALTLSVGNSQFSDSAASAPGNVGLQINLNNNASVAVSIDGSAFLRNFANGVEYLGNDSTGGNVSVTNSTFDANAIDVNIAHQGLGKTVDFNVTNNSLRQTIGGLSNSIAITLGVVSNNTTQLRGKIQNNVIGNAAVSGSGSNQGSGIVLTAGGGGSLTALVAGNTVGQVDNEGLNFTAGESTGTSNLTVSNNSFSVNPTSPNSDFGMLLVAGAIAGDTATLCANVTNNHDVGNAANGGDGIALATEGGTPTFNIQGYTGAANNATQIASFVDGKNTDTPVPAFIFAGAGTMRAAPSACLTPP